MVGHAKPSQGSHEAPRPERRAAGRRAQPTPGPLWSWLARRTVGPGTPLQRREAAGGAEPAAVPASVGETVGSTGCALDGETRARFEPQLGDLGGVRIHT